MSFDFQNIVEALDIVGRAGGGGSGGSGGGAAGGAFWIIVLIALIGYFPMHFLGAKIRKRTIITDDWYKGRLMGWGASVAFFLLLIALGLSVLLVTDDAGTVVMTVSFGIIVGIGGFVGMGAGLYAWWATLKRSRETSLQLKRSADLDPAWDEPSILKTAEELFRRYQDDWANRNIDAMKAYMTIPYHQHASLLVAVLLQSKRINTISDIKIKKMMVVASVDSDEDYMDRVVVGIEASATDELIDEEDGQILFTDKRPFVEYWQLVRREDTWLVYGIVQATAVKLDEEVLKKFAEDRGYFYSRDMGWLFIPKRGAIFAGATFGQSDINNHIVGIYNQTYLLQLYTYIAAGQTYIIAQTNVPKKYGQIVVRRKRTFAPKIRGLRKISTEWNDFNEKYEVLASDEEAATSFELLHPAFMEKLEALPINVNIEVVDNVVYLYTLVKSLKNRPEEYEIMLEILDEAYKQMKL